MISDIWVFGREAGRRLIATIRQDGWRVGAQKTTQFLARYLRRNNAGTKGAAYLRPFWQDIACQSAFHAPSTKAADQPHRIAMIADLGLPQCEKYRVRQLAEIWASLGVDYTIADWRDVPRACEIMQTATHLMLYRVTATPELEMYLYEARRLGLPVAYDLDDPLFCIAAYETYGNMAALPAAMKAHFLAEAPHYLAAMNQADIVTVSTPGMVAQTQLYTRRPVYLRRNFADAETLAAAEIALDQDRPERTGFRVGFSSGSMGHEVDFAAIADDLTRFLAADPSRKLVILGHFNLDRLPADLRARVEHHAFTDYAAYLAVLASLDCAVMPLTDDIFNGCKSGVRVLDAMAVKVPVLVSDIGDLGILVTEGVTGHVLQAGDDWCVALERLASDRAAVTAMGQAAHDSLLQDWTAQTGVHVIAPELLDWVQGRS